MQRHEWHAQAVDAISRAMSECAGYRQAMFDARRAMEICGCQEPLVQVLINETSEHAPELQQMYNRLSTDQPKDSDSA